MNGMVLDRCMKLKFANVSQKYEMMYNTSVINKNLNKIDIFFDLSYQSKPYI